MVRLIVMVRVMVLNTWRGSRDQNQRSRNIDVPTIGSTDASTVASDGEPGHGTDYGHGTGHGTEAMARKERP